MHWDTAWTAVKDVLLTGTGIVLILSQVWSRTPSDLLLACGLALTAPSVYGHARALLGAPTGGPSSPPQPPSGPSASTSSPEATDDRG